MPRYVALLRAINVGGHVVKMDRLRAMFEALGFTDVETFIASGNVIFTTAARNADALERKIEAHLERELGYQVGTFLRTPAELAAVAQARPFGDADPVAAGHRLYILFLKTAPPADAAPKLAALETPDEELRILGREMYWLSRKTISESTIKEKDMARALGAVAATNRNVTTVRKLAAKYPA